MDYLLCCKYTSDNKILDLLEDLAFGKIKYQVNDYINLHDLYLKILSKFNMQDQNEQKIQSKSWSSIRLKNLKELKLQNFIINTTIRYQFSDNTKNFFTQDLIHGIKFKTINDKNIVMSNNEISKITGLTLDQNRYEWNFDLYKFKK